MVASVWGWRAEVCGAEGVASRAILVSALRRLRLRDAAPVRALAAGLAAAAALGASALPARAQETADTAWLRANYAKTEVAIPMRDGVELFTAIYAPRDTTRRYPILLARTPYSVRPYGADAYAAPLGPEPLVRDGYIFVFQDVRGRFMSEGEFVNMRPHRPVKRGPTDVDESTDTWDTIDWLVRNVPGNNGRVGTHGISYPGFYTAAGMIDAHPAHRAASPQAPIADWFAGDDFHRNGAFWLPHAFHFLAVFGQPRPAPTTEWSPPRFRPWTPDGYRFFLDLGPLSNVNARYYHDSIAFWNEIVAHPDYDGFWRARDLRPHLRDIRPAVLVVGGWFDAENLFGALQVYRSVERQSPGARNTLVMGPWFHGGWRRGDGEALGDIAFGSATSVFYRDSVEAPFFACELKDRCGPPPPEALVFETGSNVWRRYDAWPPPAAVQRALYLREDGGLSFEPPLPARAAAGGEAADEFVSDPARPVPFTAEITQRMTREYMTEDQRFASTRPDVLVYESEPLAEPVTVAGPVQVRLWVSTTGGDADWVVKLIDVLPDSMPGVGPHTGTPLGGYQMLVRGEVMRGRYRNSLTRPEPFTPGEPTRVDFALNDVNHTFLPGHRIMVQVQSTWFPLMDRNPQTFVPNIFLAAPEDFRKATHRVYRSPERPSRLELPLLP